MHLVVFKDKVINLYLIFLGSWKENAKTLRTLAHLYVRVNFPMKLIQHLTDFFSEPSVLCQISLYAWQYSKALIQLRRRQLKIFFWIYNLL